MTRQERWLTAASFREPDRVPIELQISAKARQLPECAKIVDFIDNGADNLGGLAGGPQWGFFGLTSDYTEETIEDSPGEFLRKRKVHKTAVGAFYAITRHFYPHIDSPDFQWERRFVHTLEDLERLANAPREIRPFSPEKQFQAMGVDAIEPLEPVPYGDVDLAEAKRRMHGKMMLSGNIPSQCFPSCSPDQVREWVRQAIRDAAPGGGFALRTTGGHAGVNPDLPPETLSHIIKNVEAYIETALEFGAYPA